MKRHPASLKLNIAYGIACGHTQREIGAALGVHQSTISRHARRPDVAEMIQVEEKKVVRVWEEQIERATRDPAVKAEVFELCKQALMKGAKKSLR
jgi:IS30 family transposase